MKIRQGITLEVFGQDGVSWRRSGRAISRRFARSLAGLDGQLDRAWDWESVANTWPRLNAARVARLRVPGPARRRAAQRDGNGRRRARPDEIRAMQELIRQAMREGAFGLSTG